MRRAGKPAKRPAAVVVAILGAGASLALLAFAPTLLAKTRAIVKFAGNFAARSSIGEDERPVSPNGAPITQYDEFTQTALAGTPGTQDAVPVQAQMLTEEQRQAARGDLVSPGNEFERDPSRVSAPLAASAPAAPTAGPEAAITTPGENCRLERLNESAGIDLTVTPPASSKPSTPSAIEAGKNPTPTPPTAGTPPVSTRPGSTPTLPPPGGNTPAPPVGAITQVVSGASTPSFLATATGIQNIAVETERQDFLDSVLDIRREVLDTARADNQAVAEPYLKVPLSQLSTYLGRAEQTLGDTVRDLGQARSGMDRGELARFQNIYMNARDKAALGMSALAEEERKAKPLGDTTPFAGLLGPEARNPLSRTASLAEIFGGALGPETAPKGARLPAGRNDSSATSADALANRIVMFNGLPPEQREATLGRLRLVERVNVKLADGSSRQIPILHNGYIFGAGSSGLDCSSFVSSALPSDVRRGRFTTLDFRQMWIYAKTGRFQRPPQYDKTRAALVREAAGAFVPIDLYSGETLATGDLLVYRLPWEAAGHVFVVRRYDERTMMADVIEAAQSAGTVRERKFPMSADPTHSGVRLVRPGFLALRLRPQNNRVCGLKTALVRPQAPLEIPAADAKAHRSPTGAP